MSYELVRVDFHGDELVAAVDDSGRILVGFRRVCGILGLDYGKQLTKLKSRSWAYVTRTTLTVDSGVRRDVTAIDLKTLHGWLLSVHEDRVREEIRPKLIRYQAECVDVLERYFRGLLAPPPPPYKPWAERFRETFAPHQREVLTQFPPGSFTVITEGVMTMVMLEDELIRHMMEVRPGDRPCISIGLTYSHYRKNHLNRGPAIGEVTIYLPDQGRDAPVKVYSGNELHLFKTWLNFVYLPEKLQSYLDHKPEFHDYGSLPRASVADNTCRTITGRPACLRPSTRRLLQASNGFVPAALPRPPRPQLPPK